MFKTVLRALLATGLLVGGIASLTLRGVPGLHGSLAATQTPVPMTCLELFRGGPPETAMVHLTDATVVLPETDQTNAWTDGLPGPLVAAVDWLPIDRWTASTARGQIVPRGRTMVGAVSPLVLTAGADVAARAEQASQSGDGLIVVVQRDHLRLASRRTLAALSMPIPDFLRAADDPRHVLRPVAEVPPLRSALVVLAAGGISITLALLLAMSLRPGLWIFVVPLTGLIAIAMFPFHRPAGRFTTAALRMIVGAVLIAAAYHLIVRRGGLATSLADPLAITGGILVGCTGLAICLRTINAFIPSGDELRQLFGWLPTGGLGASRLRSLSRLTKAQPAAKAQPPPNRNRPPRQRPATGRPSPS